VNLIKSGKFDEITDDFGNRIDEIVIERFERREKEN